MIQPERVREMNRKSPARGRFVAYWMQAAQRADDNHALEYAVRRANEMGLPLVAFLGLTARYPSANARHYAFMLQGLKETQADLGRRGIRMAVLNGDPPRVAVEMAKDAAMMVVDAGHLRIQRQWRDVVARRIAVPLVEVETNLIVPIEDASPKEEYAAATFRPKVELKLGRYLVRLRKTRVKKTSFHLRFDDVDVSDVGVTLARLGCASGAAPVKTFRGGTRAAKRLLARFIRNGLKRYADDRNDPSLDGVSHMSPYLHFGQISPLTIALKVGREGGEGADAYLEELIVRRELSHNYVHYNRLYDRYDGLPEWCRRTLEKHTRDRRPYVYTRRQLESAHTHDPYWNSAQLEMMCTGKMHGYMRMYWGKKILEWSATPQDAFATALYLNDKYELDGRDPNGYTGIAWCFGKHDRPWGERAIYGTVRCMVADGLKRKFDADAYVERAEREWQGG